MVAAKSGVTKSVGSHQVLYGNPAGHRIEKQREAVSLRKVPQLWRWAKELARRLERLERRDQGEALESLQPPWVMA